MTTGRINQVVIGIFHCHLGEAMGQQSRRPRLPAAGTPTAHALLNFSPWDSSHASRSQRSRRPCAFHLSWSRDGGHASHGCPWPTLPPPMTINFYRPSFISEFHGSAVTPATVARCRCSRRPCTLLQTPSFFTVTQPGGQTSAESLPSQPCSQSLHVSDQTRLSISLRRGGRRLGHRRQTEVPQQQPKQRHQPLGAQGHGLQ